MKAFLNSMTARIFLILVGGTIITGALVTALAMSEREALDKQVRTSHTAERIEQLIKVLDVVPSADRTTVADVLNQYGVKVDFSQSTTTIGEVPDSGITTDLRSDLRSALGKNREISVYESESVNCPTRKSDIDSAIKATPHCETIFATLKDGTPIRLDVAHRNPPPPPFRGNFIRDLMLFLAGLSLIALVIAHMATKPLRKLAQAARDLSGNIEHPSLLLDQGSTEVREASLAFNSMQTSIRSHIEERTCMLAAIAHDLQTPLTRLRLRLEKVEDSELREKLVGDLTATQNMVREGLDFARIFSVEETLELVDLDSLVESICNDAVDTGAEVTCEGKIGRPIMASSHALRRCISNLLDNAVNYGEYAHVSMVREGNKAIVTVIDGGAGIPESQLEAVFLPFNRLEQSRSRSTGGTGLGLTIARIIAVKHKGLIKLKNMSAATELGLMATLELPIVTD